VSMVIRRAEGLASKDSNGKKKSPKVRALVYLPCKVTLRLTGSLSLSLFMFIYIYIYIYAYGCVLIDTYKQHIYIHTLCKVTLS
jgi:hypothetical protein